MRPSPRSHLRAAKRVAASCALALCALSPTYFAQLGLLQTDLPATTLCAWAWLLALYNRRAGFAALASLAVLTKESSIFICLPAALLIGIRHTDWRPRAGGRLLPFIGSLLRYAWPTTIPALVLFMWLLLHRALTGHLVAADHLEAIMALPTLTGALLHSFVESGRPLLLLAACPAVLPALRGADGAGGRRWEILMTGLGVFVLPIVFSAGLPPAGKELWNTYTSLSDGASRAAFLRAARSVVDYRGQAVHAMSQLHIAAQLPVLLIWGERDWVVPVSHGHAAHRAMPGSRLTVLADAGHFPHVQAPDAVATVLRDFVDTTERRSAKITRC